MTNDQAPMTNDGTLARGLPICNLQSVICNLQSALLVLVLCSPLHAFIPLALSPSWSSTSTDHSTGGGFADIDTNGFLDFCISNGNDMGEEYNAVYFNRDGILENTASWRSADNDRFGHLYLGDVDNDGLDDMAVVHLGSPSSGRARVYHNTGTGLDPTPWWQSKDSTSSFDCCFGDVNNDGWLDLAVSAGDPYSGTSQPLKVYYNRGGQLDTLPAWQSVNLVQSDAVRFADLDRDGKLDLVATGRSRVYVYYQRGESLEFTPSWIDSAPGSLMGVRLAVGDYDRDGWLDLAAVLNGQMSTQHNVIRVYNNDSGVLTKPAAYTLQRRNIYSSCVAWGDANNDGYLDLAAGGWWEPAVVYENSGGALDTTPAWSWSHGGDLVCEAVVWGDLRNRFLVTAEEQASGDGARKVFYLQRTPVQRLIGVEVSAVPIPRSAYAFDPLAGCIMMRGTPPPGTNNLTFRYVYSEFPDLGLTNWNDGDCNYVFFNTTPTAITERRPPNPARGLQLRRTGRNPLQLEAIVPELTQATITIYSIDGRRVETPARGLGPGRHEVTCRQNNRLTKGLYFARISATDGSETSCKLTNY